MMTASDSIQKNLACRAALLMLIGFVTGIWVAAAITQKFGIGDGKLALASHLNALLGGLWMIAVAWSFKFLHYDEKGLRRLSFFVTLPNYANWFVTLVASFLRVNGLEYTSNMRNNIIAAALQALVVIPTFIGAGMWVWGFKGKAEGGRQKAE